MWVNRPGPKICSTVIMKFSIIFLFHVESCTNFPAQTDTHRHTRYKDCDLIVAATLMDTIVSVFLIFSNIKVLKKTST